MKYVKFFFLFCFIIGKFHLFSQNTQSVNYKSKDAISITVGGGIWALVKRSTNDTRLLRYGHLRTNYWLNNRWTPFLEYNWGKRTFTLSPDANKVYHALGLGSQYYIGKHKHFYIDASFHIGRLNFFDEKEVTANIPTTGSLGVGVQVRIYKNLYGSIDYKYYKHFYKSLPYIAGNFNLIYYLSKNNRRSLKSLD